MLTDGSLFVNVRHRDLKVSILDSFKHTIQAQAPNRVLPHSTFELHCIPVVYGMHLWVHMIGRFGYGDLLATLYRVRTPCSFVGC